MKKGYNLNSYIALFLLLIIVSVFILPSMRNIKFADMADEGHYLRYAVAISNKGLFEFRNLFTEFIKNENNWIFPNPLRIGFIFISSLFCRIFGNSFVSIAYLSFFSYLLLIVITFYFCNKIFGKKTAVLLSILIAFSPLNMAMSRRALSESMSTLFLGLSIWLFLDIVVNKDKRIINKILLSFVISLSVLIKETCFFLLIPFFLFIVFYRGRLKDKIKWPDLLYIFAYPLFFVFLIYLLALGDLLKVLEVTKAVSVAVKTNQYAVLYGSGPWFRYIIDYILLSPWVVILSTGFIFAYLISEESDARISYFLIVFATLFVTLNIFTKNVRYVMILDIPLRLFSVLMLQELTENRFPKQAFILTVALVITLSVFDYLNFRDLFLKENIYDPVSFSLLRAKHIIPYK